MPDSERSPTTLPRALETALAQRDRAGAVAAALDAVRDGRIAHPRPLRRGPRPPARGIGSRVAARHRARVGGALRLARGAHDRRVALPRRQRAARPKSPAAARRVLLACPPEEQHDLGLRMLADRFELAGWDVTSSAPTRRSTRSSPRRSATRRRPRRAVRLDALRPRRAAPRRRRAARAAPGVRIVVGGPAFSRRPSTGPPRSSSTPPSSACPARRAAG